MFPTLNGYSPDWATAEIVLNIPGGLTIEDADVQAITCSDSLDIGTQRGKGGRKKGRGVGQVDNEASMTLYRTGHRTMTRAIMAAAPSTNGQKQLSLVSFDLLYKHTPPGESGIFLVKILGCRLAGRTFSGTEGAELEMVEWPLNIMSIVEVIDGVEVVLL
jgi:hypothetical protein